jgi:hypothetical protein
VNRKAVRTRANRRVRTHTRVNRKAVRTRAKRKARRTTKTQRISTPHRAPSRRISRMHIGSHKFSVWRGKHRVRHNNRWRTFVTVGSLGAIMFGSNNYYPYAYVSADEMYCSGLTDEGCQLRWREVETVEGNLVYQCVAYCPWR